MDWIAVLTLVVAAASLVVGVIALRMSHRSRPPGGYDVAHASTPEGDFIVFGALGAMRLFSVRFETRGAKMLMDGEEYNAWPLPSGVRLVDVEREVHIPIRYESESDTEPATVEISWVSDRDRYSVRERIRYDLKRRVTHEWRRYRVRIWRSEPGRWVERKEVPEVDLSG